MASPIVLKNKVGMNGLGAGVWDTGPGGDPFGGRTREPIPILDRLTVLAGAGMTYYKTLEVDRKKIEQIRKGNRLTALSGYLAQCLYGR